MSVNLVNRTTGELQQVAGMFGGLGDMSTSTYDSTHTVANAGGIPAYVNGVFGDKADKVSSAVSGNFAGLDASGNITDSGSKASDFVSASDLSGKADKVTSATSGDFAGLDANGNLTDSGKSAGDFAAAVHSHAWSDITSKPFSTVGSGLTVTSDTIAADIQTVTVASTGTASSTGISKQQITVNNTAYDIQGTAYMEQDILLSTSDPVIATFTNAAITANSRIGVFVSDYTICPVNVVASSGTCSVTFPKASSAQTITVGIEVA